MNTQQTVFIGLSGGVDSSVAALRLKRAGYNVVGVFIKVWHPQWLVCNWEQERLDAMRIAAALDIPFLTCDAEAAYKADVADYFISEYVQGRTPNPDVMCNKYVKFGRFLTFARQYGADAIATGHYAQRIRNDTGSHTVYELHRGADKNKDQSYFLWTLTQAELAHTLFPVGDTPKEIIRAEAEAAGLPTAKKKDSQGICFLGQVDIKEFLSHYIELIPGTVLNEHGEVVGEHDGAIIYTRGQRHGFTIKTPTSERPAYFVTERNIEDNTITVSTERPVLQHEHTLTLNAVSYTAVPVQSGQSVSIQTRYRQPAIAATITMAATDTLTLTLNAPVDTPAVGQSCVLYDGDQCLGGGIITPCQSTL